MSERHHTGGNHEFNYSKDDLKRIRSTDTQSTKAFKEAYAQWQSRRVEERKLEEEMRAQRRRLIYILIFLFVALALLLFMRFFG